MRMEANYSCILTAPDCHPHTNTALAALFATNKNHTEHEHMCTCFVGFDLPGEPEPDVSAFHIGAGFTCGTFAFWPTEPVAFHWKVWKNRKNHDFFFLSLPTRFHFLWDSRLFNNIFGIRFTFTLNPMLTNLTANMMIQIRRPFYLFTFKKSRISWLRR